MAVSKVMFRRVTVLFLSLLLMFSLTSCSDNSKGTVYLYAESSHGDAAILEEALEIWQYLYHEQGTRHLFCEYGYFTAQFLNLWMQDNDNTLLDQWFEEIKGTQAHTDAQYQFFLTLKETCPETVFHGTDVGHQYWSTGQRYLEYLEDHGMTETEAYRLTLEAMEQGHTFYENTDTDAYREIIMCNNFMREYEQLKNEDVMGIYGGVHAVLDGMSLHRDVESMAHQLHNKYGDTIRNITLNDIPFLN